MITEDYVSYEVAKLLIEKGFGVNTFIKYADKEGATEEWYDDYRERMLRFKWNCGTLITPPTEPHDKYRVYGDTIPAPSLALAMKWLREKEIFVEVTHTLFSSPHKYQYSIFCTEPEFYTTGDEYKSYEKACEAAIKYCLENLI